MCRNGSSLKDSRAGNLINHLHGIKIASGYSLVVLGSSSHSHLLRTAEASSIEMDIVWMKNDFHSRHGVFTQTKKTTKR